MYRIFLIVIMLNCAAIARAQHSTEGIESSRTFGDALAAQQTKVFPVGFHDFEPVPEYRAASTRTRDIFCSDWRKTLSLHKRIREWQLQGRGKGEAYELSLKEVLEANRPTRVCWWDDQEDTTDAVATRGYVELVDGKEVLRPVRIHRFRNGIYVGYHLGE